MDTMLVVVLDNEEKAYEATTALQELQNEGSIDVFRKAVVVRDADGKVQVKQQEDMGPVGSGLGLLTGTLIGLLGGPVGVVIGAGLGTYGGLVYDLLRLGSNEEFVSDVEETLQPGKAAVVAEVWEEWTTPVDSRMKPLGGTVIRRSSKEVWDAQIDEENAEIKADLAAQKAEFNKATGEARAKLQLQMAATKVKLEANRDKIQASLVASEKDTDAKVASLQKQADKSSGEQKAKLEKHINELKADQKHRSDHLKQSLEETKKDLSE